MNAKPDKITPEPSTPLSSAKSSMASSRTIHVVTMSKGGCGKTVVSLNLVQYLRDRNRSVVAVDLDPMNHSLAQYPGLGAKTVDLLIGDDAVFNGAEMDQLSETIITASPGTREDFVLDNGAAGFVGLTRYLCDNAFADMLDTAPAPGRLLIHAVLGGGSASTQCLGGLYTLRKAFEKSSSVRFVIWLNEHAGQVSADGKWFEDMALYKEMMADDRVLGIVRLEALKRAFADDFARMHEAGLTYSEAISSPNSSLKFLLMNKQRLKIIRDGIWSQLDALGLGA